MSTKNIPISESILGFPISASPFSDQISLIIHWGQEKISRVVCVANVHMLMEARWNPSFAEVLHSADLITPDGMPLVWMMNLLRHCTHDRVAGMDIFREVCQRASVIGLKVYFLGTDASTLAKMRQRLRQEFPTLQIAGMAPLPFRPLTPEEDQDVIATINDSQAGIVFLALGCPKQEIWMHQHREQIQAVMVGLGGVFPVYAGIVKHAPQWVRASGLEWFYRLRQEPLRLWKRYSRTIPPFVFLSLKQVLASRVSRTAERTLHSRKV
ncbi:MAG: WecB/TagA/CpsF family glycosyltransferase [Nodosilinea sp.]